MVRNQTDDAFAVSDGKLFAGVGEAFAQAVDPEAAIRIEHHLDNRRVFEPCGDVGPQSGSEHARATGEASDLNVWTVIGGPALDYGVDQEDL